MNGIHLPYLHQRPIGRWGTLRMLGISNGPPGKPGLLVHFSLQVLCDQDELISHVTLQALLLIREHYCEDAAVLYPPDPSREKWQRILFTRYFENPPLRNPFAFLQGTSTMLRQAEAAGKASLADAYSDCILSMNVTRSGR